MPTALSHVTGTASRVGMGRGVNALPAPSSSAPFPAGAPGPRGVAPHGLCRLFTGKGPPVMARGFLCPSTPFRKVRRFPLPRESGTPAGVGTSGDPAG